MTTLTSHPIWVVYIAISWPPSQVSPFAPCLFPNCKMTTLPGIFKVFSIGRIPWKDWTEGFMPNLVYVSKNQFYPICLWFSKLECSLKWQEITIENWESFIWGIIMLKNLPTGINILKAMCSVEQIRRWQVSVIDCPQQSTCCKMTTTTTILKW